MKAGETPAPLAAPLAAPAAAEPFAKSVERALLALVTFGSYGSPPKKEGSHDLSVSGAFRTVILLLLVYGVAREPFHLRVFGYALMMALGFTVGGAVA